MIFFTHDFFMTFLYTILHDLYGIHNIVDVYFPEIGTGWAPAFLNSQRELDFILRSHSHTDLQRYWIGGYTQMFSAATIRLVNFTNTSTYSGNHVMTCFEGK